MSKNIKKDQQDNDDDWETDPDYVNDVTLKSCCLIL